MMGGLFVQVLKVLGYVHVASTKNLWTSWIKLSGWCNCEKNI